MSNTIAVTTEGDTIITVTPEGNVTVGVEYNPVAGSGADTNIGITRTNAAVTVTSSSGSDGTILAADSSNAGVFTAANFTKLAAITGTNTGDQAIFKNIAVAGQSTVVADTTNDTLTLVAGTNITLTTDALTDSVTITASGGGGSGDVVGPASATNGAFALFDTTTGKLLKNGSVPGGAATLNVGTTTGTVAAGDDSRLTNARTPTAHASTHVTGGSDAIQSATASQNGLATATQITKLDGIEAGADVTDATNVAAAGAVMKTLADAKGDLFAATAADTVTRLPIGATNGHVLTVDSAETTGMKWAVSSGGDVVGPASSTDNAFARFDSTTGKLLQNSTATLDDVGLASVDGVQFSPTPTSAVGPAKAVWNATDSCLSIGLNSSVNALVGTDSHVQVYNESASTMTVMQVVRQSGSSGTRLSVELAMANTDANSATSIGVVAQTIASNAQGFIQTSGLLQGVNTNAFNEGDTLWLSPTTAGLITNVRPTAPNHSVRIGYCIKKAGGAGIILIDILNGFELGELHDVVITEPVSDNSFLTYDTTTSTWINSTDVPAAQLTGTIDNARLPATITGLTSVSSTTFVGALTGTASGNLVAGGALGTPSSGTLTNCTSIPAGQLTGSVATARLGTGTADATTYLRGDATWATVSGGAGTKTIVQFTPRDNQPPATNFATLDTRNSIAVLDFDTATEEAAIFNGVIPEGAVLTSGLTVRITWTAATATSGDCRWGAQWMRLNTDIDSDSFDTATEVTTTTNATSGIPSVTSITCTAIDGATVGDAFRLRIYRDTGDAADTMAGDAELITVEVRTAN